MKINWFTVIAQVINFLILVWLLRRFLYKPVLKAIDEREKKIASQLEEAKVKMADAKKEEDLFRSKNEAFDQQQKGLMDKANQEYATEKGRLMELARKEATAFQSKLEKASLEAQQNVNSGIIQKVQGEVFAISRKALTDLASQSLEEQSVNIFINRFHHLNEEERKLFLSAFRSGSNPIVVTSAFNLASDLQSRIKTAVDEITGKENSFQFKTVPELISGIEIAVNGYKLAWSISEYLRRLEKNIEERIQAKTGAGQETGQEQDSKTEQNKNTEPRKK